MPKKIRPIRVEGQLAYVTLTKGYTAVIDAADVSLVSGYNWQASVDGNTVYARRGDYSGQRLRTLRMHRVILAAADDLQVDHRNGDGLDNRRANLRTATKAQNMHNRRPNNNSTSAYKGVGFYKTSGKYRARIMVNGKQRTLGLFATPEAAHAAYCNASAELHGKYGRTK
jgi:hypothetical protein